MRDNIQVLALAIVLSATIVACKKQCTNRFEKSFSVNNFSSIEVGGNFQVAVVPSTVFSLKADGCEDDVNDVLVAIRDNKLSVTFKDKTREHSIVGLQIGMPLLQTFLVSGNGSLRLLAVRCSNKLKGEISGSSSAVIETNVDSLDLDVNGQSKGEVILRMNHLKAVVSGQSKLNTSNSLNTGSVNVELSGMSEGRVRCTNRLTANLSGQSKLYYKGNPTFKSINASGQSEAIAE